MSSVRLLDGFKVYELSLKVDLIYVMGMILSSLIVRPRWELSWVFSGTDVSGKRSRRANRSLK